MAEIPVPYLSRETLADRLLETLAENGPVVRLGELLEDQHPRRAALDELWIEGDVQVFTVGDHVMVKHLDSDQEVEGDASPGDSIRSGG